MLAHEATRIVHGEKAADSARLGNRKVRSIGHLVTDEDLEGGSVLLRAGKRKVHRVKKA